VQLETTGCCMSREWLCSSLCGVSTKPRNFIRLWTSTGTGVFDDLVFKYELREESGHALPKWYQCIRTSSYSFQSISYNKEKWATSGRGEGRPKNFKMRKGAGSDAGIQYEKRMALYFCQMTQLVW
jgi:hypothetical protein